MKLRLVQPFILLPLLLQLGGPAYPVLGPAEAFAALPAPAAECLEPLEEPDAVPAFLKDRAAYREKFQALESITAFPAEMLGKFDADMKMLNNSENALAAKVLVIRNAEQSVDIAHFIFKADRSGKVIIAETKAALLRGVTVRILVDSFGSKAAILGVVSDLKALLAANRDKPGKKGTVEVVIFNPQMHLSATVKKWFTRFKNLFRDKDDKIPLDNRATNNRLHDKVVAADLEIPEKAVAIMGGRGIEDVYYPMYGYRPNTFRDMEVIIRHVRAPTGPFNLGSVLGAYYDSLYYHLGNKFLSLGLRNFLGPLARARLRAMERTAAADLTEGAPLATRIEQLSRERFLEDGFEPVSMQFVNEAENALRKGVWRDDLEHDRFTSANPGSLTMSLRERIKESDDTIDIVTPYVWFPPEEVQMLQDWVDAKPTRKVRIITASIATDDSVVAQALIDSDVGPVFMSNPSWSNSRGQIIVYTYGKMDDLRYGGVNHYGRLHAKYYIFDGKLVLVTSFNADPRSRYWSTESGFYIGDNPTAVSGFVADADNLAAKSTVWGSPEWKAVQNHPRNKAKTLLKELVGRIMRALHLSPLV